MRNRFALLIVLGLAACSSQRQATEVPFTPDPNQPVVNPTWYRDVLPIARANCQSCHRPDGIAPFSMLEYDTLKDFIDLMSEKVNERKMPPWMPSKECGEYEGERRLTEDQIATITRWAQAGGPAGNPADAPPGGDAQVPHLPSVDLTIDPGLDYTPKGNHDDPDNLDDYHCFVMDPKLTTDEDVVAYEITPGTTREVHHVILFAAEKADTDAADAAEAGPGWTCFGGPGVPATNGLGGWVPGMPPTRYPETTGIQLKAGQQIVMQIHYNQLNVAAAPDRTKIALKFADTPVQKRALSLPVFDGSFAIPPGGQPYTATNTFNAPGSGYVWGVTPHMHQMGRHIRVEAGGKCLVDVPDWDFSWQQTYFFKGAPRFVAGSEKITISCTWENNTNKVVTWGEGTSDEMCIAFLYSTL
jgi:mono/diheme cytochrome c family protein